MTELISVKSITHSTVTMTSLELVALINEFRKRQAEAAGQEFPSKGFAELRHSDFLTKVPEVLGNEAERNFSFSYQPAPDSRKYPCYRFPKREACLMAMSYSYELQAAVYDRMTLLEEQGRALALPQTLPEALRLAADLAEKAECLARERDEAIRTKSWISSSREAKALARASAETRRANALKARLGLAEDYMTVKAITWLPKVFDVKRKGFYSQIGKELGKFSKLNGFPVEEVRDERFGKVKTYFKSAVEAFFDELGENRAILEKYRLPAKARAGQAV